MPQEATRSHPSSWQLVFRQLHPHQTWKIPISGEVIATIQLQSINPFLESGLTRSSQMVSYRTVNCGDVSVPHQCLTWLVFLFFGDALAISLRASCARRSHQTKKKKRKKKRSPRSLRLSSHVHNNTSDLTRFDTSPNHDRGHDESRFVSKRDDRQAGRQARPPTRDRSYANTSDHKATEFRRE